MPEEIEEELENIEQNENDINDLKEDKYTKNEGECKKFHNEPYWTPNNYDIFLDHNLVPSNIKHEPAASLQKRLQRLMPLTKYIHLNMDSEELNQTNHIMISSKMKINNKEVNFI